MEPRTNADYLITDSIHIGKTEFGIRENLTPLRHDVCHMGVQERRQLLLGSLYGQPRGG